MPIWIVIAGFSAVLFVIGARRLLIADRPVMVMEACLAWLIAVLIPVVGYWYNPGTFDLLTESVPWLHEWLDWAPPLIAGFYVIIALANLLYFWLEEAEPIRRVSLLYDPSRLTVPGMPEANAQNAEQRSMPPGGIAEPEMVDDTAVAEPGSPGSSRVHDGGANWRRMLADGELRRALKITAAEHQLLYSVGFMGKAGGPEELRLVLDAIRKARSRPAGPVGG